MTRNATTSRTADVDSADVVVIGDGVIGLSTALELCRRETSCIIVGASRAGTASGAAAGLLAPSVGTLPEDVRPFFDDSLARYPAFLDGLRQHEPTLALLVGLIDLSRRDPSDPAGERLSAAELQTLEPALGHGRAARFFPADAAIDNVSLLRALRRAVERSPAAQRVSDDPVISIRLDSRAVAVQLASGRLLTGGKLVVAAGAWATDIGGLPRALPVYPLKGQMLSVAPTALRHPIMSDDVYLVPRGAELVIGATAERAGFDLAIDPGAIETLRRAAIDVCPGIETAPVVRTWAGIRPATPDMLPIIGVDPADPRLIYACGHSKNGILLAPATAVAVAALAMGGNSGADLRPFSISRFAN